MSGGLVRTYQPQEDEIQQMIELGVPRQEAIRALQVTGGVMNAVDYYYGQQESGPSSQNSPEQPESLDDAQIAPEPAPKPISVPSLAIPSLPAAPLDRDQRLRLEGVPVGLKNCGNTCYFNSLMQTYFMIPGLVQAIQEFQVHPDYSDTNFEGTEKASIQTVEHLKKLFGYMTLSNKKFVDPSPVLNSLVDDVGNQLSIGDQKDVGEYNIDLVSRIEEGLKKSLPPPPPEPSQEAQEPPEEMKEDTDPAEATLEDSEQAEDPPEDSDQVDELEIPGFRRQMSTNLSGSKSALITSELSNTNILTNKFYGQQMTILTANEADGTVFEEKQTNPFGMMILDIQYRELYKAIDDYLYSEIDEFTTPSGHKTSAVQNSWITEIPNILLFQIQRVQYDADAMCSRKNHSEFKFPEIFYADRMLYKNYERASELRNKVKALRDQTTQIEKQLDDLANYRKSGKPLTFWIENILAFLQGDQSVDQNEIQLMDPSALLKVSKSDPKLVAQTIQYFQSSLDAVNSKIVTLKQELATCYSDIEVVFKNAPDMRNKEYHLHAILVHTGFADGGHYFTYIFDRAQNIWRRYSDNEVWEVSSEKVYEDSIGGSGLTSAYCLVYVDLTHLISEKDQKMRDFSIQAQDSFSESTYANWIEPVIKSEIMEDNMRLLDQLEEQKITDRFQQMTDLYTSRYSKFYINYYNSQSQAEGRGYQFHKSFELFSLAVFVATKRGYEQTGKWLLLNSCIREIDPEGRGIRDIGVEDKIYEKLRHWTFTHYTAPDSFRLSESDLCEVEEFYDEYKNKRSDASVSYYIIRSMNKSKFLEATHGFNYLANLPREISKYQQMSIKVMKVLVLRLCSELNRQAYLKNIAGLSDVLDMIKYMIMLVQFNGPQFKLTGQISLNIDWLVTWSREELADIWNDEIDSKLTRTIESLESGEIESDLDLSQIPEDFTKLLATNEEYDYWQVGDLSNDIAQQLHTEHTRYASEYGLWIQVTRQVELRGPFEQTGMRILEEKVGIYPGMTEEEEDQN